jgi:hypothetical protein
MLTALSCTLFLLNQGARIYQKPRAVLKYLVTKGVHEKY